MVPTGSSNEAKEDVCDCDRLVLLMDSAVSPLFSRALSARTLVAVISSGN